MSYQWKPGMTAVCIDNSHPRWVTLALGAHYTVLSAVICRCGKMKLQVNSITPPHRWWNGITRCPCGHNHHGDWYRPERFRPLEPLMDQLDRLEKEGCPTSLPEPVLR